MAALKTATKNLIDQLHGAATTDGDVYVSIIPFSKDVNLDKSNFASDWIYWGTVTGTPAQDPTMADDASWDANNGSCSSGSWSTRAKCRSNVGTCSVSGYTNQDSCTSSGICNHGGYSSESTCTSHGTCSNPSYTKKSNCQNHGGTWTVNTWTSYNGIWTVTGTWTPKVHNATTWNGCVTDRGNEDDPDLTYNFDTNASPPDPVTPRWSSLYAAEQYSSCPKAVKGLTYEWDNMKTLVDSMSPAGNTTKGLACRSGGCRLSAAARSLRRRWILTSNTSRSSF